MAAATAAKLNGGQIAGIVIGSLAGVALIFFLVNRYCMKKSESQPVPTSDFNTVDGSYANDGGYGNDPHTMKQKTMPMSEEEYNPMI